MSSDEKPMRISQHDRIRIGPDRAQESLHIKQILRATHDGPDRFVIVVWLDQDQPPPTLVPIRGCALGRLVVDGPARALVAELMFERPLDRGETVVTEHEFIWGTSPPEANVDHYRRALRHQVRECLIEVDFHPDMRPKRCEEVFRPEGRPEDAIRQALVLDEAGRVHAVAVGDGPGDLGIHWEWD